MKASVKEEFYRDTVKDLEIYQLYAQGKLSRKENKNNN